MIEYRNYMQEILNTMSNSDIMNIILDKKKELKDLTKDIWNIDIDKLKLLVNPTNIEWKQIFAIDRINIFKKIIHRLEFELRQRDPDTKTNNTKDLLDKKKIEVNIVTIISVLTWKQINKTNINISCPLPNHKDDWPSFHIYEKTNSWKCFGCQKGWSWIDFIKEFKQISLSQAIKEFLLF